MEIKPHEPPRTPTLGSDMLGLSVDGIWRDGRYLMLNVGRSSFPIRCVKTNEPVSMLTSEPISWPVSLIAQIFVGLLFAKALWGKSTNLNIGLSDGLQKKRRRLIQTGWGLALGGIIGLILFTFIYVAAMVSGVQDSTGDLLMFIPLVFAFAAMAGIPVLVVAYIPFLRVKKWSPDRLWLAGVHPDFLRALPPWSRG